MNAHENRLAACLIWEAPKEKKLRCWEKTPVNTKIIGQCSGNTHYYVWRHFQCHSRSPTNPLSLYARLLCHCSDGRSLLNSLSSPQSVSVLLVVHHNTTKTSINRNYVFGAFLISALLVNRNKQHLSRRPDQQHIEHVWDVCPKKTKNEEISTCCFHVSCKSSRWHTSKLLVSSFLLRLLGGHFIFTITYMCQDNARKNVRQKKEVKKQLKWKRKE